jgi:hypothetical protein
MEASYKPTLKSDSVEGLLNYVAPTGEKLFNYMYPPPPGMPQTNRRSDPRKMLIHNGRTCAEEIALDKQGFMLVRYPTSVRDFYSDNEVRAVYYLEIERLLKETVGVVKVLIFDHTLRSGATEKRSSRGIKDPVTAAHVDYTLKSGPQRVRDLLPLAEAEERLKRRFAEINVWRSINGPVLSAPLAVCDARSVRQTDLVETEQRYPNRFGEIYAVRFNPNHRWFYFPEMQPDEALLIKGYDSMDDGRARFTPHTSFDDPTSPPNAPRRESIEVRTLVFFA